MSEHASMARVLLHEASERVEGDAIRASERGPYVEPWTAQELMTAALVNAVLAIAERRERPRRGANVRRAGWMPRRMRRPPGYAGPIKGRR